MTPSALVAAAALVNTATDGDALQTVADLDQFVERWLDRVADPGPR